MNFFKNKFSPSFFIIFICLLTFITSNAQNRQTFEGSFLLKNDLEGQANYQYYIDKRDTVKQGNFSFLSIEETEKVFDCVKIEGVYNKNYKNGKWTYSFKNLEKGSLETLEDNKLVYKTSGKEKKIVGDYKSSKANGTWIAIEQKIRDSKATDTISLVKANYTNGILTGEILAFNEQFEFAGHTNNEGLADKTWTIVHKEINVTEHRIYKNGIIQDHCFEENGDTIFCNYVGFDKEIDEDELWENINIDKKYFALLEYINLGVVKNGDKKADDAYLDKINRSNDFILSLLWSISENNQVNFGNFLKGSTPIKKVKAKVRKYPFTKEEKAEMSKAHDLLLENMELLDDFFKNPDVEINIYTNQDLMFTYEIMNIFKDNFDKQKSYIDKISKSEYEYLNRSTFLEQTLPYPNYPEKVNYTFRDSEFTESYDFPNIDVEQENKFQIMLDHLTEMRNALKDLEDLSSKYLATSTKESKLAPLEKKMVTKKDSILNLYKNKSNREDFNEYHENVAQKIETMVRGEVKNYSELPLEDKMDAISTLNDCFGNILKLYEKQAEIPKKIDRLDEVYTRVVFNPYTFTDMEERIKERIYKAYENNLKDFVLDDMQEHITCNDIKKKYNNFELLYRKMMVLRDKDTKDIERELRRVNNPIKIMEILELEIDVN